MIKHEMINDDVLREVANKYMNFFVSQINEYADYTAKTVNMKDVGTEQFEALLSRMFKFGPLGLVQEGEMLPCDMDDISKFAKMEGALNIFEDEAVCSLLDEAVSGRVKLCLYEEIPLGDIYDLHTAFEYFEDMAALDLTFRELAALANMTERSVRNEMLKAPKGVVYRKGPNEQLIDVKFAHEWLKARKEFKPTKNLSGMEGLEDEYVNVPVASDGTLFDYNCEYKRGGYTVGEKGDEIKVPDYYEALQYLIAMPLAKWRRPNKAGNFGIVSAVAWKRVKRSEVTR